MLDVRFLVLVYTVVATACGRISFDELGSSSADAGGVVFPCDPRALRENFRSIGTSTVSHSNKATVDANSCALTFEVALDPDVGPGDVIVFGGGLLYIRTVDGPTAVTLDYPAVKKHVAEDVSIRRAYNDLATWETAIQGDLVSDDRSETGVARRDGPLGGLVIDGSQTDATRTITLKGHESHRGRINTGVVLDGLGTVCHGIDILDNNVEIDNLELTRFNPDAGCGPAGIVIDGTGVLVQNLLVYDYDTNVPNSSAAVRLSDNPNVSGVVRNVFAVRGKVGTRVPQDTAGSSLLVENCTFHSMSEYGVQQAAQGGAMTVRNTIATAAGTADFIGASMIRERTISSDATATGVGSLTLVDPTTLFVSTSAGAEDLHLLPAAPAVEAGLDLSVRFQHDIDGELRPRGTAWDIGADEY